MLLILAAVIALPGMLFAYQAIGIAWDKRRHPPPGLLTRAEGVNLHVLREGIGEPLVVLESGLAASSASWAMVQPQIASFTSVLSYDRAGFGWSKQSNKPRSVQQLVRELHVILDELAPAPEFVLVGHSFGGLLVRSFANLHPDRVAGLVLVDPVCLHSWAHCSGEKRRRLQMGVRLSRRGAWLARLGVVRLALAVLAAGGRWFPKLIARTASGPGAQLMQRLLGEVRKLPQSVWPALRAHWSCSKCFETMACHLETLPENAAEALAMPLPDHIPLIVLSAATATDEELEERDGWVRENRNARHIRIDNSGHWLQLERPTEVVKAVDELVTLCRSMTHTRELPSSG